VLDLNFTVETAEQLPHAAAPLLVFKLRITATAGDHEPTTIPAIALRCQIRIEPTRRRYQPSEQEQLLDLFGEPARWGQTLRSTLWTHASAVVAPFVGTTLVDLPVPCTFDFNVAATKYFHALEDGGVPLCLLFTGTIFYSDDDGFLQVSQIPWEKEASSGPGGTGHDDFGVGALFAARRPGGRPVPLAGNKVAGRGVHCLRNRRMHEGRRSCRLHLAGSGRATYRSG
jgi:hypothetical protein